MLDRDSGLPPPWTDDAILQRYRFCNVFREDDKTTRWFRDSFRSKIIHPSLLLQGTIVFRWFNRIETGEILLREKLLHRWDSDRARRALSGINPLVTGAYMVKTPARVSKLEGVIWCIEQILPSVREIAEEMESSRSLERSTNILSGFPYLGPFMAYEIVTDLRHTPLLCRAKDIYTWANPGPGAARGLGRVFHDDKDFFDRHASGQASQMQEEMAELLEMSRAAANWPRPWPAWEMRDVEHTLCEFDKYERARLGTGKPKQLFRGGQHEQ